MTAALAPIAEGFQLLLLWPTPAYLLLGVVIGYVVGVLPGFGAPAALALVLPSIIALRPIDGFVLLTAIAAVASMAGDITSILLGVPGEATSAAIVPDGHAMTRRGLGGIAVGAALTAAWLGATIGAVVLGLILPFARPLFSLMQSPELAALAVLGLCLVTPLSRAHTTKGLAAAAFGVALATIGLDPTLGEPRLTFGQLGLWDGVGLLPLALGLYAVPEALDMIRGSSARQDTSGTGHRGVVEGCTATLRRLGLVLRSGMLGAGIGVLPGVGAATSQWVAYAHASQKPGTSTPFGEGAIEGVIAPAATTTATLGGALLPTLLLGIPGSVTSAFLLGALTFKGLTPGPNLLLPEHEGGHLALIWSLVWCIVVASLIGAALSALSIGWVGKLANAHPSKLLPFILTLVIIGTIGERHLMADLGILIVLGLVGYTMSVLNWPRAPLMLGFVLGPLLERRWLLSHTVYGWWWLLRPGVVLLIVLAVAFLYATTRSRAPRRSGALDVPRLTRGDTAVACVLALLAVAGFWWSAALSPRAALFPRVAFTAQLVCALAYLWAARRNAVGATATDGDENRRHLVRIGWLGGFISSAWLFGPVLGATLAATIYGLVEARARAHEVAAMSAAIGLTAYVLVSQFMPFTNDGIAMQWLTR